MPQFDTPEPISVTLDFEVGSARIAATDRADTVVEVLPDDGAADADVRAAQQTQVSYTRGRLLVKGPRKRSLFGRSGSISVIIEVPEGSSVHAKGAVADLTAEGRLGECRLHTSVGDVRVTEADETNVRTGLGDVAVDRATGEVVITGAGRVDTGELRGNATIKNLNGETVVGEVWGDLKVNSSNGRITVGVAHARVDARSAQGRIRIGSVRGGPVDLQTSAGDLEIGIPEPIAAWLDVNSRFGKVRNSLGPAEGPSGSDGTVEVRARTSLGDVVIRRS
ncbi:DUF4097 family beta strand repeat-containing protein [Streptomyces sp. NPDC000594]|uniref:DUF4097 family beta strand repeat-containing protein n=1 Tax=Streptomyces sp. NPDC000594 TaxID=3154261 RepID=UPI00332AFE51